MSHFELVSIFYYRVKSIFWVKQVVQTNLSFPILSWSVKLVHNSSAGKLVFSLKMSIITINGSGIVDIQELSGFNSIEYWLGVPF